MKNKAEVHILWDNERGLEGNVIIKCTKDLKGKIVRIMIAQLDVIKSSLIDDLKKDNTNMNIEFNVGEDDGTA